MFGALAVVASLGAGGCNFFVNLGAKARGSVDTLTKRNVDFDRPAPGEKDLEGVQAVAVGPLEGDSGHAAMISGYLATHLGDSGRFSLVDPTRADDEPAEQEKKKSSKKKKAKEERAAGTAAIEGSILQAEYSEREDSQSSKCGDKTCVTRTRIGTAVVTVDLRLVDAATGEVLVRKTLEDRKETKTSARDGSPPSIDGNALLDEAARKVAGDFFATVSPHVVSETVFFETDNAAKSLKEGANRAMSGDLEGAIAAFEEGLEQAVTKEDDAAIAKARYDLGLALVIKGEYDRGLELLHEAQGPKAKKSWAETVLAAKRWKTDAERAAAQWAAGEGAPELDPALRPSEQATAEGAKALKTLRSATGV